MNATVLDLTLGIPVSNATWHETNKIVFGWRHLYPGCIDSPCTHLHLPFVGAANRSKSAQESYVLGLSRKVVCKIGDAINGLSDMEKSAHFWDWVLSYWVEKLIFVLADRWTLVESATAAHIESLRISSRDVNVLTPKWSRDFDSQCLGTTWNSNVWALMAEHLGINIVEAALPEKPKPEVVPSQGLRAKQLMMRMSDLLAGGLNKSQQLVEPGYITNDVIKNLFLRDHFRFVTATRAWPLDQPKMSLRSELKDFNPASAFEEFVALHVMKFVPVSMLEGIKQSIRSSRRFPEEPKRVVLSSFHYFDEVIRMWLAEISAKGTSVAVYQHGGVFNTTRFVPWQDTDKRLFGEWISWGVHKTDEVTRVGYISKVSKSQRRKHPDPRQDLMTVELTNGSRFLQHGLSQANTSEWDIYFKQVELFLNSVRTDALGLLARCSRHDFERNIVERLSISSPHVKIDNGFTPIDKLRNRSALWISTYDGTGYLESMALGIPTIMWWDPTVWQSSPRAKESLDELRNVGVLHDSWVSAAACVNEIAEDVDVWWQDVGRQRVVSSFLTSFARVDPSGGRMIRDLIRGRREGISSNQCF